MLAESTSRSSENSEEARALLQARVALFWKVMFYWMGVASVLGIAGAFKNPGADLVVDVQHGTPDRLARQILAALP